MQTKPSVNKVSNAKKPGMAVTTTVKAGDVDFAAEGRKLLA